MNKFDINKPEGKLRIRNEKKYKKRDRKLGWWKTTSWWNSTVDKTKTSASENWWKNTMQPETTTYWAPKPTKSTWGSDISATNRVWWSSTKNPTTYNWAGWSNPWRNPVVSSTNLITKTQTNPWMKETKAQMDPWVKTKTETDPWMKTIKTKSDPWMRATKPPINPWMKATKPPINPWIESKDSSTDDIKRWEPKSTSKDLWTSNSASNDYPWSAGKKVVETSWGKKSTKILDSEDQVHDLPQGSYEMNDESDAYPDNGDGDETWNVVKKIDISDTTDNNWNVVNKNDISDSTYNNWKVINKYKVSVDNNYMNSNKKLYKNGNIDKSSGDTSWLQNSMEADKMKLKQKKRYRRRQKNRADAK